MVQPSLRLQITSLIFLLLSVQLLNSQSTVSLGIDVLEASGFRAIKGKKVGLLTHPAGVNRHGVSSIDILKRAHGVKLVALYGPEHGIYGDEKANVPVDDKIDKRTELPVYSLYGKYRKPPPHLIQDLDALIIDLQDIGTRSYTYISCMRYAMEACFENDVEVIILDRPNPLGGLKADGPMLDPEWRSYVGAFNIPYVHGLTIGEIARISKNTSGWLNTTESTRRAGKLTVVPMEGWSREMLWPTTGLEWIPTSPYVPDLSAVLGYAMTGLGAQEGGFSHGIGTPYPFRLLSYSGKTPQALLYALNKEAIKGLDYEIIKTQSVRGKSVSGVYVKVADWAQLRPTELSFRMMQLSTKWEPRNPFKNMKNSNLFNKHIGSTAWYNEIINRGSQARVNLFVEEWSRNARSFHEMTRQFWLYR